MLTYLKASGKFKEIENVSQKKVLRFNGLSIDSVHRRVQRGEIIIKLTHFEFEILYFLASHPGQVFTKEQIYYQVWNQVCYKAENNVVSMIRRIRKKVELDPDNPIFIQTVWGSGYKFNHTLNEKEE